MKTYSLSRSLVPGQIRNRFLLLVSSSLLIGILLTGCQDHIDHSPVPSVLTLATGLLGPIGVDTDATGRIWVAEAGTGKNDGRVSIINNGTVIPAITGFNSFIFQGSVEGVNHLLFADGILYILGPDAKLYKINPALFKTGDTPSLVKNIPFEDIGSFVVAQTVAGIVTDNPNKESHPYQLTVGPNGDLFIADAAANVIIRRAKGTGALSIYANIPGIANPTPVGPPFIQGVPTGLVFNGPNLLVSTLIGFPFPAGKAIVYQVSPAGVVSVHQHGFNSLTGLDLNNGLLVLEYGLFGPQGFTANSGRLLRANNPGTTVLVSGLNLPTALKKITANSYFVVSFGDKSLLKVTF